ETGGLFGLVEEDGGDVVAYGNAGGGGGGVGGGEGFEALGRCVGRPGDQIHVLVRRGGVADAFAELEGVFGFYFGFVEAAVEAVEGGRGGGAGGSVGGRGSAGT